MFNEREMSKAIDWLFELFSPEDYEGYDEDEIGYAGGLCLPEVCTALRGAAQTVYQYSVAGGYEKAPLTARMILPSVRFRVRNCPTF